MAVFVRDVCSTFLMTLHKTETPSILQLEMNTFGKTRQRLYCLITRDEDLRSDMLFSIRNCDPDALSGPTEAQHLS